MREFTQDDLWETMQTLGWNVSQDDIALEIGGTVVSGIDQPEGYNKKWSSPKGFRKYNKDAFIVIKNRSRDPYAPSLSSEQQKLNDEVK